MIVIEIQTLIDITNTKVNRPRKGFDKEYDQCKNFTTLKQCIELRSNISFDTDPIVETKDLKSLGFGDKFKGKHKVWTFRFTPERNGVYHNGINEIGHLIEDLGEVPVIKNLDETINISTSIFDLKNQELKNTIIKAIKGTI